MYIKLTIKSVRVADAKYGDPTAKSIVSVPK